MKKFSMFLFLVLVVLPMSSFAAGTSCATKYPVVLAHGMGASAEILGVVDYWWGIEDALENEGADVYITSVNGMDGTAAKAADFKRQFLDILAVTGKAKANIIGHSHGTLYTRYAVSNLGLGSKTASHTSIAGPHRGSAIADLIMYGIPDSLKPAVAGSLDLIYTFVFGDTNPNTLQNGWDLTRNNMINVFNPNTPNVPGLYYQSWAAKAKTGCPSVVLEPTWLILLGMEGANDGLVSVESAKWGNFRGVQDAAWYSPGCDHLNIVGQFMGITPGFSAPAFYTGIVKELKSKGY
jgi:triacylglycerol lipase